MDCYTQCHECNTDFIPLDWYTQFHDVSQVLSPWTGTLSVMMYHMFYPPGLVHSGP